MKYIIVIGGVISGVGKGLTACSIAKLFKSMDYKVTMIKTDSYLNIDAGTLSPHEHGECFVLSDGGECDLDLGNYERALNINLTRDHNLTGGRINQIISEKERNGDYLGDTVMIIPHVTGEIVSHIRTTCKASNPDICIIEIGGTVGHYENIPFLEAINQMRCFPEPDDSFCFVHVAKLIENPEPKTKPIQDSVGLLRMRGITPDILVVRSNEMIGSNVKGTLKTFCYIQPDDIINSPNVPSIYHIPEMIYKQGICSRIANRLSIPTKEINNPYASIVNRSENLPVIKVGVIGKYTKSSDTYLSIQRALDHASFSLNVKVEFHLIDSENLPEDLSCYDRFIIPGGFGSRGIPGKLLVAKYARENKIPILGLCLGLQIMVTDCYNHLTDKTGCSREWTEVIDDQDSDYIVDILPNQTGIKGGTMRLGNYTSTLIESRTKDLYRSDTIVERHRHRYEVNNKYIEKIESTGLKFVGYSISSNGTRLMEVCELADHPFYIGCQYHPEFKSRIEAPHPLFLGLLSVK